MLELLGLAPKDIEPTIIIVLLIVGAIGLIIYKKNKKKGKW